MNYLKVVLKFVRDLANIKLQKAKNVLRVFLSVSQKITRQAQYYNNLDILFF
ncbi:MAG: hypothetical protein OHK0038_01100 [Flammeovirgaceae bacterium]